MRGGKNALTGKFSETKREKTKKKNERSVIHERSSAHGPTAPVRGIAELIADC